MKYEEATFKCNSKEAIYRRSKGVRHFKTYSFWFDDLISDEDKKADDWEISKNCDKINYLISELDGVWCYACDTLSGRQDKQETIKWHRDGWKEIKSRISRAIQLVQDQPPLSKLFWELHNEESVLGENDCSNKAGKYARELKQQGYDVGVVVLYKPESNPDFHAVVKVEDEFYYDPTFGTWGMDLGAFGQYRFSIDVDSLDDWGNEFK